MDMTYRFAEILFCTALYAFIGWALEVCLIAATERRFLNRGLLNLPVKISFGVTMAVLMVTLPALEGSAAMQVLMCIAVTEIVRRFSELFARGVGDARMKQALVGRRRILTRLALLVTIGGMYELIYLIVHPVIFGFMLLLPDIVVSAAAYTVWILITADFICVRYALYSVPTRRMEESTRKLGNRMVSAIWKRLEHAYPGADEPEDLLDGTHTFACGLCFDKLVWVFLISSLLGALIEMVYCYATGGGWINRSSVLYGPFSFVWGFGAVVLTVTLQRFMGREDRYTFLAGFVVGGVYECMCSVFTELVFGTVFWDYSHMTLSLAGGRTNVVYCVFWGILSVVWVKILYPFMARSIERIPPLAGKILTWAILIVMGFNGLLTAAAMMRYTERQAEIVPQGQIRTLIDERYDDACMEARWPNMKMIQE